jgi:hypothetical protein
MKEWKDLGNGQWKLTVTADGDPTAQPSVFRGTRDEIADKLADSAANAAKRLGELRRSSGGNGSHSAPSSAGSPPRSLSPEERMQTVADLSNPATVDKGVTRVLESVIGPVDGFREREQVRAAEMAASQFFERTPDWYPSDHNKKTLARYVFAQRLDPTRVESYTQAFEYLTEAQLLQVKPPEADNDNDEPEAAEGRNAPVTPTPTQPAPKTPTRFSTSIRSSDISGRAPEPSGKPRLKYTREQLENLSASDYKRLIQTDRAELERCENYYAKNPRRRAS